MQPIMARCGQYKGKKIGSFLIVAKSYTLCQDAEMRRYGSLININPSVTYYVFVLVVTSGFSFSFQMNQT